MTPTPSAVVKKPRNNDACELLSEKLRNTLMQQANEAVERKDYQEYEQLNKRLIGLYPEGGAPFSVYNNHAASLLQIDEYEKAVEQSDHSIRLNPNFYNGHFHRGTALAALYDQGKDCFEEARASLRQHARAQAEVQ